MVYLRQKSTKKLSQHLFPISHLQQQPHGGNTTPTFNTCQAGTVCMCSYLPDCDKHLIDRTPKTEQPKIFNGGNIFRPAAAHLPVFWVAKNFFNLMSV